MQSSYVYLDKIIHKNFLDESECDFYEYDNGDVFYGTTYAYSAKPFGFGVYFYLNGDIYEGEWYDGKMNGFGYFYFKNGSWFEGDFDDNHMHGKGCYYNNDGSREEVTYDHDVLSGEYKEYDCNGVLVEAGNYENDKKNGTAFQYDAEGNYKTIKYLDGKIIEFGESTILNGHGTKRLSRGMYIGCLVDGKPHGQGTITYDNGDRFEGQWKNGVKSGFGTYYFSDGGKYEGNWEDNSYNGYGVRTYINGDKYDGNWINGQRFGFGIYYFNNGNRFEGNWVQNRRHGKGVTYFKNGEKRKDNYHNGKLHGEIQHTYRLKTETELWENGQYIGKVLSQDKSGNIVFSYANGDRFEGKVINLKPISGTLFYSNGDVYTGQFLNYAKKGFGTMVYSDGKTIYRGNWDNDTYNGQGTLKTTKGEYKGKFLDGVFSGFGKFNYSSGEYYEGNWLNGERNGKGTLIEANGIKYIGTFENGKLFGEGTIIYAKGDKREGSFECSLLNGKVLYTKADGSRYIEMWEYGKKISQKECKNLFTKLKDLFNKDKTK